MRKAVKKLIELLSPTWAPLVVEAVKVKRAHKKETKPRQPGGGRKRCLTDEDAAEIAASTEVGFSVGVPFRRYGTDDLQLPAEDEMTDIDDRRREIMRHLDERYYARWARINAETADERALRLGQPTSIDLRMRGQLRYSAGQWVYHHSGNSDTAGSDYDYRQ